MVTIFPQNKYKESMEEGERLRERKRDRLRETDRQKKRKKGDNFTNQMF